MSQHLDFRVGELRHVHGNEPRRDEAEAVKVLQGRHERVAAVPGHRVGAVSRVLHFGSRLVQVNVERNLEGTQAF